MIAFLLGPIGRYLIMGLVVLSVIGGAYLKGRSAGKEVERAELQPKLDACKSQVAGLESALATQERAVQALKAEGDARVKKATEGLKLAAAAMQATRTEAERLRGLAKAPQAVTACPAGEAVSEIRKGLLK